MAQTDQQLQNEKLTVQNVHFRWMGSNAPIASLKANDPLVYLYTFYSGILDEDLYSLRSWLATKLGPEPTRWIQVTLYSGKQRLTHDVLLATHLYQYDYDCHDPEFFRFGDRRRSMMPHIGEACRSFFTQLAKPTTTTTEMVVHVTRCSDADCDAVLTLADNFWRWFDTKDAAICDVWDKYRNNVAFMINFVATESDAFSHAPLKMRQNELLALAALKSDICNAKFVSSVLWNKPSFVLKAAASTNHDLTKYLGPAVRDDAATMLCLIKIDSEYFDAATSKTDFDFQCLAAAADPDVLCKLDTPTQTKVNERNTLRTSHC